VKLRRSFRLWQLVVVLHCLSCSWKMFYANTQILALSGVQEVSGSAHGDFSAIKQRFGVAAHCSLDAAVVVRADDGNVFRQGQLNSNFTNRPYGRRTSRPCGQRNRISEYAATVENSPSRCQDSRRETQIR